MNRFDWLDDATIEAAFERRAARGSAAGIREAIMAETSAARQVGTWRRWIQLPQVGRPPRAALVLLALIACILGTLLAIFISGHLQPDRRGLLVYARDGDVFVAEPDGSHAVLVAHDDAVSFRNPAWSPAGRWVALDSADGVFLLDTQGSGIRRLPGRSFAAWSSDGHSLALIEDAPSGPVNGFPESFVRILDLDTGMTRDVRATTGESINGLIWSPDGRWFLAEITLHEPGPQGGAASWFARIDAASGSVQRIEPLVHLTHPEAAWAHDGSRFVYTRYDPCPSPPCHGVVAVADPGTLTTVVLGDPTRNSSGAVWSPDDNWLAFQSRPFASGNSCCSAVGKASPITGGGVPIYISHPDGSGLRQLSTSIAWPLEGQLGGISWNADGSGVDYVDVDVATGRAGDVHEISLANGSVTTLAQEDPLPAGVDDYAWQTIPDGAGIPAVPSALLPISESTFPAPTLSPAPITPDADPARVSSGLGLSRDCSAGKVSFATWAFTVVGTACNEGPGGYWSPVGGAFASDNLDGTITITRADGTRVRTSAAAGSLAQPSGELRWSPDGKWLYHLTDAGSTTVMAAADGTSARILPGAPSWSADSSRMAVQDSTGQLLMGHGDASDLAPIGALPLPSTWAPDGLAFAFIRDGDVWTVGVDGQNPRNVTAFPLGGASGVAWSPDGGSLVVLQGSRLWIIATDGTRLRSMDAEGRGEFGSVTWSPDGTRFGVATGDGGAAIVRLADWRGGLVDDVLGPFVWSPDGRFVAYVERGGAVSIANGDGSGTRQIWTATDDYPWPPSALAWLP